MTAELQTLAKRLADLERSNRRLRRAVTALTLFFVGLTCSAFVIQTTPAVTDEVIAKKFTLVNTEGKRKAVWETTGELELPALVFYGHEDKARIEVSVQPNEAMLVLRDLKGRNRVGMAVDKYPHLMLHDDGQKPRIHMSVGHSGASSLLFIHKDGSFPGGMGIKGDGKPWIKPDGLLDLLKPKK